MYYQTDPFGTVAAPYLDLTDAPDICCDLQANARRANGTRIEVQLWHKTDGFFDTLTAGTYPLTGFDGAVNAPGTQGGLIFASFEKDNVSCSSADATSATSGSVTVTTIDANFVVHGTFDLTFHGDHVTGSFDAPFCSSIPASGSDTPSCF
jgi:hypothetical protein